MNINMQKKFGIGYAPKGQQQLYQYLQQQGFSEQELQQSGLVIQRKEGKGYFDRFHMKANSVNDRLKSLSGGNQQKAILARWLATDPDFLILDEPTRGIDIGTKTEIQKLVLKLADEGKSVMFISSEIEEMLRTCNRMAVLRDGAKVGEISGDDLTQEGVMKAIAGGGK